MTDGIGAELVRLQYEMREQAERSEHRHAEILDGIGKIELGLAQALEIISREPEPIVEAEPEAEIEPEGVEGEEVTEGEIVEVETEGEASDTEEIQTILIDDAIDNLEQIGPFGYR